jgi:dGTPase
MTGLRAGLFGVDDLKVMPLTADIIADTGKAYPGLDDVRRGAGTGTGADLLHDLGRSSGGRQRLEAAEPQSATTSAITTSR